MKVMKSILIFVVCAIASIKANESAETMVTVNTPKVRTLKSDRGPMCRMKIELPCKKAKECFWRIDKCYRK